MNLLISILQQKLTVIDDNMPIAEFDISSSKYGEGQEMGSFKTPMGRHIIKAKIGAGYPERSVFIGRRATGEICDNSLYASDPNRDWILTRILWLSGLEKGFNRTGNFDTMRRYIYIHGTPDEAGIGQKLSCGCIRMRNSEIIELFNMVPVGCLVEIK